MLKNSIIKILKIILMKRRVKEFILFLRINSIDYWMVMQPYWKKYHKNIHTVKLRLIQDACLVFPLFSQLLRYFFEKETIFTELTYFFSIIKELKLRKIKGLARFRIVPFLDRFYINYKLHLVLTSSPYGFINVCIYLWRNF